MTDNGWLDRRAAEGQRQAFREALNANLNETPPFRGFRKAMEFIQPKSGLLLDVGCGAGGYAALVDKYWPQLDYLGCDISNYMIEFAREDYGDRFFVCDVMDLDRGAEIILGSSIVEVCPDWQAVLSHLLSLPFGSLILSRARVWHDPEHATTEQFYITGYGTTSFEVTHNKKELTDAIAEGGGLVTFCYAYQVEPDTSLLTMVVEESGNQKLLYSSRF